MHIDYSGSGCVTMRCPCMPAARRAIREIAGLGTKKRGTWERVTGSLALEQFVAIVERLQGGRPTEQIDDIRWYELVKGDYTIGLDVVPGDMPCAARTEEAAAAMAAVMTAKVGGGCRGCGARRVEGAAIRSDRLSRLCRMRRCRSIPRLGARQGPVGGDHPVGDQFALPLPHQNCSGGVAGLTLTTFSRGRRRVTSVLSVMSAKSVKSPVEKLAADPA